MEASPAQTAGLLCESSIFLVILDNYLMHLLSDVSQTFQALVTSQPYCRLPIQRHAWKNHRFP